MFPRLRQWNPVSRTLLRAATSPKPRVERLEDRYLPSVLMSTFDSGDEGWTGNPGGIHCYVAGGGNPGGDIRMDDAGFDPNYGVVAPTGGGPVPLNSREGEPFGQRPDAVREPGGHRGGARPPAALGVLLPQRPHRPAEVVAVMDKGRDRLVRLPLLREAVGLPRLAGVAVPVGPVVSLP